MEEETVIPPLEYYSHAPDLQIRIEPSKEEYIADLSALGNWQQVSITLTRDDLENLNKKLKKTVEDIINQACSFQDACQRLANAGNVAFNEIFGNAKWIQSLLHRPDIFSIQITSKNFIFPWELLYASDPNESVSANQFWGMKYIISRVIPPPQNLGAFVPPEISFTTAPKLGLLAYDGLHNVAQKEIPFFVQKEREGKIQLIRLCSLDPLPTQTLAEISKFKEFWANAFDLAHFACHAVYSNGDPYNSYLLVNNNFCITLADLKRYVSTINGSPLVVLNTCKTSNMNSLHTTYFASVFCKLGTRAVVATEADIPDNFAARFAEFLYSCLLDKQDLGSSILLARRFFMSSGEIFGLLYALYGSPFVRLHENG